MKMYGMQAFWKSTQKLPEEEMDALLVSKILDEHLRLLHLMSTAVETSPQARIKPLNPTDGFNFLMRELQSWRRDGIISTAICSATSPGNGKGKLVKSNSKANAEGESHACCAFHENMQLRDMLAEARRKIIASDESLHHLNQADTSLRQQLNESKRDVERHRATREFVQKPMSLAFIALPPSASSSPQLRLGEINAERRRSHKRWCHLQQCYNEAVETIKRMKHDALRLPESDQSIVSTRKTNQRGLAKSTEELAECNEEKQQLIATTEELRQQVIRLERERVQNEAVRDHLQEKYDQSFESIRKARAGSSRGGGATNGSWNSTQESQKKLIEALQKELATANSKLKLVDNASKEERERFNAAMKGARFDTTRAEQERSKLRLQLDAVQNQLDKNNSDRRTEAEKFIATFRQKQDLERNAHAERIEGQKERNELRSTLENSRSAMQSLRTRLEEEIVNLWDEKQDHLAVIRRLQEAEAQRIRSPSSDSSAAFEEQIKKLTRDLAEVEAERKELERVFKDSKKEKTRMLNKSKKDKAISTAELEEFRLASVRWASEVKRIEKEKESLQLVKIRFEQEIIELRAEKEKDLVIIRTLQQTDNSHPASVSDAQVQEAKTAVKRISIMLTQSEATIAQLRAENMTMLMESIGVK